MSEKEEREGENLRSDLHNHSTNLCFAAIDVARFAAHFAAFDAALSTARVRGALSLAPFVLGMCALSPPSKRQAF